MERDTLGTEMLGAGLMGRSPGELNAGADKFGAGWNGRSGLGAWTRLGVGTRSGAEMMGVGRVGTMVGGGTKKDSMVVGRGLEGIKGSTGTTGTEGTGASTGTTGTEGTGTGMGDCSSGTGNCSTVVWDDGRLDGASMVVAEGRTETGEESTFVVEGSLMGTEDGSTFVVEEGMMTGTGAGVGTGAEAGAGTGAETGDWSMIVGTRMGTETMVAGSTGTGDASMVEG